MADTHDNANAENSPRPSRLRGLFSARTFKAVALLGGCAALLGALATAWVIMDSSNYVVEPDRLSEGLALLDEGDYKGAKQLALEIRSERPLSPSGDGGPVFLSGAATAIEAAAAFSPQERLQLNLVASRFLNEARFRGFPPGRETEGLFLLGRSLHDAGRFADSFPVLQEAEARLAAELPSDPRMTQVVSMLADTAANLEPPQLKTALEYTDDLLAMKNLPAEETANAHRLRALILLTAGQLVQAEDSLTKIAPELATAPASLVLSGRIRLAQGDTAQQAADKAALESPTGPDPEASTRAPEAIAKYSEAEQQFRLAVEGSEPGQAALGEAAYLLGVALLKQGEKEKATKQFGVAWGVSPDTTSGIAAAVSQADLLREQGEFKDAYELYTLALLRAKAIQPYESRWLPRADFIQRLSVAGLDYSQQGEHEKAIQLADSSSQIAPPATVERLRGEITAGHGTRLLEVAQQLPTGEERRTALREARSMIRSAGNIYANLAAISIASREYPALLGTSGDYYFLGRDFKMAVQMYEKQLDEIPRIARPATLNDLGNAHFELANFEEALSAWMECVSMHPNHPESYRARVLASEAKFQLNDLEGAKKLLLENIQNESLTPRSLEWRDSLFAIGRIALRQASDLDAESRALGVDEEEPELIKRGLDKLSQSHAALEEAYRYFDEAVRRYPQAEQVLEARYGAAEAQRMAAHFPQRKLKVVSLESTLVSLNQQTNKALAGAMNGYDGLIKTLTQIQDQRALTSIEERTLRNCYFNRPDVLFDQGKYTEAIAAYSSATNKYNDSPTALEAFVQISRCYRQLQRTAEARGAVEQAKVLLSRIPDDVDMSQTTRYSRAEWTDMLDWLSQL